MAKGLAVEHGRCAGLVLWGGGSTELEPEADTGNRAYRGHHKQELGTGGKLGKPRKGRMREEPWGSSALCASPSWGPAAEAPGNAMHGAGQGPGVTLAASEVHSVLGFLRRSTACQANRGLCQHS